MISHLATRRAGHVNPSLMIAMGTRSNVIKAIATAASTQAGLPVAVSAALDGLLHANVIKVIASIAIWLPYLLLSKRVNVTFRHRLPA